MTITISGTPPAGTVGAAYAFTPTVQTGPATAPILAVADQTVKAPSLATSAQISTGLPFGAMAWPRPLDPADQAPYCMDFTNLLGDANISDIISITMSATGSAVGVQIENAAPRLPILGDDGKTVQMWFSVLDASESLPIFSGAGVQVGVSIHIRTNATPTQDYERTAVLTVRRL